MFRADYQGSDPNGQWQLPYWTKVDKKHGKLYYFAINMFAMLITVGAIYGLLWYTGIV